jgi:RNA polymerase sigma factor (sigma-70 family)
VARLPSSGDPSAPAVRAVEPRAASTNAETRRQELSRVVRDQAASLAGTLVRVTGDFATAEDLVQDAILAALERWPQEGVPDHPDRWLFMVARNRAIDQLRRGRNYHRKLAQIQWPVEPQADDRLRLMFTCCHPALPRRAQIALTLRVVCGLTTAQIARAFVEPEPTVTRRITRAKRKIVEAQIPYRIPDPDDLDARLGEVLAVVYILLNEGYLSTADRAQSPDLVEEAEWLASQLSDLMPAQPEVAGLLALIRLHRARAGARFDGHGNLVLLKDQDRSQWDRETIADAVRLLQRAARLRRTGPYQLQAAIVACHTEAHDWAGTDWEQILVLYDMLLHLAPSPIARLNRAIALRYVAGAEAALAEVDSLADVLSRYHIYHAARASLLREIGQIDEAQAEDRLALRLTTNPAERAVLRRRLQVHPMEAELAVSVPELIASELETRGDQR